MLQWVARRACARSLFCRFCVLMNAVNDVVAYRCSLHDVASRFPVGIPVKFCWLQGDLAIYAADLPSQRIVRLFYLGLGLAKLLQAR